MCLTNTLTDQMLTNLTCSLLLCCQYLHYPLLIPRVFPFLFCFATNQSIFHCHFFIFFFFFLPISSSIFHSQFPIFPFFVVLSYIPHTFNSSIFFQFSLCFGVNSAFIVQFLVRCYQDLHFLIFLVVSSPFF